VKTLEKQNVEISKSLEFVGNNEPARPLIIQPALSFQSGAETLKKKSVRYSQESSMQLSPSHETSREASRRNCYASPTQEVTSRRSTPMTVHQSASGTKYSVRPPVLSKHTSASHLMPAMSSRESVSRPAKKRYIQRVAKDYSHLFNYDSETGLPQLETRQQPLTGR